MLAVSCVTLAVIQPALIRAAKDARIPGRGQPEREPIVLEKVLTECRCVMSGMPSTLLTRLVTDFGVFSDDELFLVAYSTSDPKEQSQANVPLHVILGDRRVGSWREKDVSLRDLPGPIESIGRSHGMFVIERKVATDGGSASLLSAELEQLGNVYYELGSEPLVLSNGLVIYQRGQPHFAPTHYVELVAYDTRTKSERDIYPVKPFDRVRREFVARVRDRWRQRGDEWFNAHNHDGNPELFDTFTVDPVLDWNSKAVAFFVHYEDSYSDEVQDRLSYELDQQVVAVCEGLASLRAVRCHETPLDAWQAAYPGETEEAILKHAAAEPRKIVW
jgi:hypothetical protein